MSCSRTTTNNFGILIAFKDFFEKSNFEKKIRIMKHYTAYKQLIGPPHKISNNVVCATSKASDQPVHTRSWIRAFAGRLNILCGATNRTSFGVSKIK